MKAIETARVVRSKNGHVQGYVLKITTRRRPEWQVYVGKGDGEPEEDRELAAFFTTVEEAVRFADSTSWRVTCLRR